MELFFAFGDRSFDRLLNLAPFINELLVLRFKTGSDKHDRLLLKQRIAFLRPAELLQKRIDLREIPPKGKHGYKLLVDRLDECTVRRELLLQLFALSLLHASDSQIQILPLGFSEVSAHLLHPQQGLVGDFLALFKRKQGLSQFIEDRPIRIDLGFRQQGYVQRAFPGKGKVSLFQERFNSTSKVFEHHPVRRTRFGGELRQLVCFKPADVNEIQHTQLEQRFDHLVASLL
ncbi:MAG: hypothetical protein BWY50_01602 [Spirochaetes bacterium ADurb.Bin315]|nr:MAG: hypothetical protein BWY50_01602 [Spirochaetes bacterium ADurb.Bin315]